MKANLATTLVAVTAALFSAGSLAGTPNTTAAGAVSYEVGQGWISDYVDETTPIRWFAYKEFAGRSYCVEASMGSGTYFPLNPDLTLYTDATGATAYLSNLDGTIEPPRNKGATICYSSPLTAGSVVRAVKVNVPVTAGSGDSGLVRVRALESTLYGEQFSFRTGVTGSSQIANTYVWLYNHSNTAVSARIYLPGYGTISLPTVPAEGSTYSIPVLSTAANYTYRSPGFVIYDGYPGAISGRFDITAPDSNNNLVLSERYPLQPR